MRIESDCLKKRREKLKASPGNTLTYTPRKAISCSSQVTPLKILIVKYLIENFHLKSVESECVEAIYTAKSLGALENSSALSKRVCGPRF